MSQFTRFCYFSSLYSVLEHTCTHPEVLNSIAHTRTANALCETGQMSVDVKALRSPEYLLVTYVINEPRYEKTGFLHMRKQRRRSAAQ